MRASGVDEEWMDEEEGGVNGKNTLLPPAWDKGEEEPFIRVGAVTFVYYNFKNAHPLERFQIKLQIIYSNFSVDH